MRFKRKYLIPLLIIALLISAIIFRQKNSTFNRSNAIEAFKNFDVVNKIVIYNSVDTTSLILTNNKWLLENGSEANKQQILGLSSILETIQIQSKVSQNNIEDFKSKFEQNSIDLLLYNAWKKVYALTFSKVDDRIAARTNKGDYYFISLLGYPELLISEVIKPDKREWMEKILINLKPHEIMGVYVEYPLIPEEGFKLEKSGSDLSLANLNDEPIQDSKPGALLDYLHFFEGVRYELVDTSLFIPNTSKHLFRLLIKTNISKVIHIDGFEMADRKTLQPTYNEFIGIVNNTLMVRLDYSDFDPILVQREYFLKK